MQASKNKQDEMQRCRCGKCGVVAQQGGVTRERQIALLKQRRRELVLERRRQLLGSRKTKEMGAAEQEEGVMQKNWEEENLRRAAENAVRRQEEEEENTTRQREENAVRRQVAGRENFFRAQLLQRFFRQLDDRLAADGLERVATPSDGNCQFHALAFMCNNRTTNHAAMRKAIVDYIRHNPQRFKTDILFTAKVTDAAKNYESVDEYCDTMQTNGIWGDAITLMAFCVALGVNICLYTEFGKTNLNPAGTAATISLVRIGSHFEATRRINGVV